MFNDGNWDKPPKSINWTSEHARLRNQILDQLVTFEHQVLGFKDPRTLLTLDFWLEELTKRASIKMVGTFRHPLTVAKSLIARNQKPISDGLALWENYNVLLLKIQKATGFSLVSFDVDSEEYARSIRRVTTEMGLAYHPIRFDQFFEDSLRHEISDNSFLIPDSISKLYEQLKSIYWEQSRR